MIEGYKILEKIGEGYSSIIYKAENILLNRVVALKVLKKMDQSSIARFKREAKILAKLNHPNIVAIYSISLEGTYKFIEMEYVSGKTLKNIIEDDDVRLGDLLGIFQEALEAIKYIHSLGVVHRDIKPDNILINTKDRLIKIVDLGLSHEGKYHDLTQSNHMLGTPFYLPPESFNGVNAVTDKSDVYSLGLTFFTLLANKGRPFDRVENIGQLYYNVMHIKNQVRRELSYKYPNEIIDLIERMVEADPLKRYNATDASLRVTQIRNKYGDRKLNEFSFKEYMLNLMSWRSIVGFLMLLLYALYELFQHIGK